MTEDEIKKLIEVILNSIPVSFTEIKISSPEEGRVLFSIESPESGLLIGNGGETLLALNHLVKRAAEKNVKDISKIKSIGIDVNDYRKKSEERIKGIASMLGERAKGLKYEVSMEPMGSYERRVVHSFFQSHPNLVTESRGFGRDRHIVIKYTENKLLDKKEENEEAEF